MGRKSITSNKQITHRKNSQLITYDIHTVYYGWISHSISGATEVSTRFSSTRYFFRLPATIFLPPLHIQLTFFHPRLTNSQTSRHATTGTAKSIRLATSHARESKPPHHGIFIRLPCPNISIQRYSAWVCSRAMKNVQPAIAP